MFVWSAICCEGNYSGRKVQLISTENATDARLKPLIEDRNSISRYHLQHCSIVGILRRVARSEREHEANTKSLSCDWLSPWTDRPCAHHIGTIRRFMSNEIRCSWLDTTFEIVQSSGHQGSVRERFRVGLACRLSADVVKTKAACARVPLVPRFRIRSLSAPSTLSFFTEQPNMQQESPSSLNLSSNASPSTNGNDNFQTKITRRSHRKSRGGCKNCKARRIKVGRTILQKNYPFARPPIHKTRVNFDFLRKTWTLSARVSPLCSMRVGLS